MSEIERLRELGAQVRPPAFSSLQELAQHRRRRDRLATLGGSALTVSLVFGGSALLGGREEADIEPAPDPSDATQLVIEADYGSDSVHRWETVMVGNDQPEHLGDTDLSLTVEHHPEHVAAWWCDGDPEVHYLVQVTRPPELPGEVEGPVWRAGGACGGSDDERGFEGHATPPEPPTAAPNDHLGFYVPLSQDVVETTTLRIVLVDEIPSSIQGCFDLPGGATPPRPCLEVEPELLADPGEVTFGALVHRREVEYVATVAGAPVQAEAQYRGTEYLFAGGVESVPGHDSVTLESDAPGYVYVVQSDPEGNAACQAAFDRAVERGDGWSWEGDSEHWDCAQPKLAELRLLLDGEPVTKAQQFEDAFVFDFGDVAILDDGSHEITLERVGGAERVVFGLVRFETAS